MNETLRDAAIGVVSILKALDFKEADEGYVWRSGSNTIGIQFQNKPTPVFVAMWVSDKGQDVFFFDLSLSDKTENVRQTKTLISWISHYQASTSTNKSHDAPMLVAA